MKTHIIDIKCISPDHQQYAAWPTVARCADGRLLASASAGRLHHVDPFGQVHLMESIDDGDTWSRPRVLVDGPLDDRDSGVLETRDGTLLVTWFTSVAWMRTMRDSAEFMSKIPADELSQWHRQTDLASEELKLAELGAWLVRSTDGGRTWSPRIDSVAGAPHGPIQLEDGRLLYAGNHRHEGKLRDSGCPYQATIGVSVSTDDGQSWRWLSDIPLMDGHEYADYHEPHIAQATDGRVVMHLRNHAEPHKYEILQTESHDGGATWSPIHSTGLLGYPAHLLRLRDGRLLTTYGYRFDPKGNRAAISEDHGATWSEPFAITDDAASSDMGYPSTVELGDGRFLTLWYEKRSDRPWVGLCQARWELTD